MGKPQSTGNLVNALAQDSSNNIGIGGAANASFKLQVTGTSLFTDGTQGLNIRAYTGGAGFGAIYSSGVTAGAGNFALAASPTQTILSGVDNVNLAINSAIKLAIASTGAATFSSSVTTGNTLYVNGDSNSIYQKALTAGSALYWDMRNSADARRAYIGFGGTADSNFVFNLNENGAMDFATNNTFRMRITSGGNVGIGTSDPIAGVLQVNKATNSQIAIVNTSVGTSWLGISSTDMVMAVESGNLIFKTGCTFPTGISTGTERMRITSGGNVVINSTVANYKFQVNSGISTSTATVMTLQQATNGAVKDAAGFGLAINNGGESTNAADLIISTASGGSLGERMRITSGGKVGIGTSSVNNEMLTINQTSANSSALLVNTIGIAAGQSYGITIQAGTNSSDRPFGVFNQGGTTQYFSILGNGVINTGSASGSPYNRTTGSAGNLFVDFDGTLYRGTGSSQRFKENIADWNASGLDTILALKPKTFTYKEDYYSQPNRQFLGLIAEEVGEVSPLLVDFKNEDGTGQIENVKYATIVVPLIKAIQELTQKVNALENK
jgi:hypothetical protein